MYWKTPHINKVYEALSAIADNRIQLISPTLAHVNSTTGNKFYTVTYDPASGAMMSDDNSAYWTNSLSYPMIAVLMVTGRLDYDKSKLPYLANIKWKDINQKFKDNLDLSTKYVISQMGHDVAKILQAEVNKIYQTVRLLQIEPFGPKKTPSSAY